MIGIVDKDNIPLVNLCTFNSGKSFHIYREPCQLNFDGGHHRLLANYLIGCDMEYILKEGLVGVSEDLLIPVCNFRLESTPVNFLYELELSKYYKKLPITEVFFRDYTKVNLALKYGTHTDYSFSPESYEQFRRRIS